MVDKISQKIVHILSYIPGIAAFANIHLQNQTIELNANDYEKSFKITESDKGNIFSIAIVVNRNTRTKIICREIVLQLTNLFKEENIAFNKINVYIRGVK